MMHLANENQMQTSRLGHLFGNSGKCASARLTVFSPGLFRLFLACVVFAQHSTRLLLGAAAVFLFFGLSGFWIAAIWEKEYVATKAPAFTFYVSRAWRILPAFWVANLLAIVIAALRGELPDAYRTFAFTPHLITLISGNFGLLGYSLLPHSQRLLDTAWSLDVEMEFYLVIPLLMLIRRPVWRVRCLFLAGFLGLCAILLYGEPVHRNLGYYIFFFGIGLYFRYSRRVPSQRLALTGLGTALLCVCICCAVPGLRGLVLASKHAAGESVHWSYAANCAFAFLMMPFAFRTVYQSSPVLDRALGDMSYLVYLFHVPALALLGEYYYSLTLRQRLPELALVWIGVFAFSFAFWALVHRPLERQRKRFTFRCKKAQVIADESSAPLVSAMADPMTRESSAAVS
jgi:peptidoglycan/LPS O-acetylase OafA/YrhL